MARVRAYSQQRPCVERPNLRSRSKPNPPPEFVSCDAPSAISVRPCQAARNVDTPHPTLLYVPRTVERDPFEDMAHFETDVLNEIQQNKVSDEVEMSNIQNKIQEEKVICKVEESETQDRGREKYNSSKIQRNAVSNKIYENTFSDGDIDIKLETFDENIECKIEIKDERLDSSPLLDELPPVLSPAAPEMCGSTPSAVSCRTQGDLELSDTSSCSPPLLSPCVFSDQEEAAPEPPDLSTEPLSSQICVLFDQEEPAPEPPDLSTEPLFSQISSDSVNSFVADFCHPELCHQTPIVATSMAKPCTSDPNIALHSTPNSKLCTLNQNSPSEIVSLNPASDFLESPLPSQDLMHSVLDSCDEPTIISESLCRAPEPSMPHSETPQVPAVFPRNKHPSEPSGSVSSEEEPLCLYVSSSKNSTDATLPSNKPGTKVSLISICKPKVTKLARPSNISLLITKTEREARTKISLPAKPIGFLPNERPSELVCSTRNNLPESPKARLTPSVPLVINPFAAPDPSTTLAPRAVPIATPISATQSLAGRNLLAKTSISKSNLVASPASPATMSRTTTNSRSLLKPRHTPNGPAKSSLHPPPANIATQSVNPSPSATPACSALPNPSVPGTVPNIKPSPARVGSAQGPRIACDLCSKTFCTVASLSRHVREKHGEVCTWLRCLHCPYSTLVKAQLTVHMEVHVREHWTQKCRSLLDRRAEDRDSALLRCTVCEFTTRIQAELVQHLHGHDAKYGCEICPMSFSKRFLLLRHMWFTHKQPRNHKVEIYKKGPSCEYKSQSRRLKNHVLTHAREQPFQCHICDRRFSQISSRDRHVGLVHFKVEQFPCPCCAYRTELRRTLIRHVDAEHREQLSQESVPGWFRCELCTRVLGSRVHLNSHIQAVHLKLVHYSCSLCRFRTTKKSHLTRHQLIHARPSKRRRNTKK